MGGTGSGVSGGRWAGFPELAPSCVPERPLLLTVAAPVAVGSAVVGVANSGDVRGGRGWAALVRGFPAVGGADFLS